MRESSLHCAMAPPDSERERLRGLPPFIAELEAAGGVWWWVWLCLAAAVVGRAATLIESSGPSNISISFLLKTGPFLELAAAVGTGLVAMATAPVAMVMELACSPGPAWLRKNCGS